LKKILVILLFLFATCIVAGQDVSGRWNGESIQSYSDDETFVNNLEVIIEQKRKKISGKLLAKQTGTQNYTVAKFNGSIKNGNFKIYPDKVLKIHFPTPNYKSICFRNYRGKLIVDEVNNRLVIEAASYGIDIKYNLVNEQYTEGNCPPSKIRLTKEIITNEEQLIKEENEKEEIVVVAEKAIKIYSKKVKIKVWDSHEEDGDLINLYLNGKLLFSNVKVSKKGEMLDIELQAGENSIEIEALNEGTTPPNTSAITVFAHEQEHEIILSAKKGERDALTIVLD